MSLGGERVKLARNAAPTTDSDSSGDDGRRRPAVFGGSTNPSLHACGPSDSDSGPWQHKADFDFLRLGPRPHPPSLAKKDETQLQDLKLDKEAGDSHYVQKTAVQMTALSSIVNRGDKALDEVSAEKDDDILSIMCDDNDDSDIFGDDTVETKRDWSSESRFGNKRKQDSPSISSPANIKRSRSLSKTPPESERSRAGSVHSRLGRSQRHQSDRDLQRLCFNFTKNGNCFRPFCPFLHLNPLTMENGTVHNRRERVRNGDVVMDHSASPHHLQKLQQQVQELQMKAQQQKTDLQSLTHNMQQIEIGLKHHATQQADQVFEQMQGQLHHQQQQHQAQLDQTKQMYGQISQAQDRMEERERLLGSLCMLLQLVLKHHLENITPSRTSNTHSSSTSRIAQLENGNMLHGPLLHDLRQLLPENKPDADCPPQPRSADYENQRRVTRDLWRSLYEGHPRRPQSADTLNRSSHQPACYARGPSHAGIPSQDPQNEWPTSRQHDWYFGPTYNCAPLMGNSQIPISQPYCHVAGNPGIVRLLPVRHSADSAFDAYPRERAPVQPR
ncbi:uncharacterized protein LOC119739783 isoform X2 [Patiria miniata]|uniref:C3H1-type domain-containing protein n=1 Tax=Patiria miniata TaxID=46514 RepID=A0A914B423_PATMI|nr:uncharacterized protein LOC119739783 isoform X2 [Patiria miniata]